MSCTDVQTIQAGNGTKTQFSFDFPYIFKSEIHVYFWNATTKEYDEKLTTDSTYPWRITDANPTIVEFTGTAPPAPATPVDPGESTVDNVKIRRITQIDDIRALFNPGSAIRSDDLNNNFEQLKYAIQEANCQGIPDDVDQYLKDYYWDRFDNTLYSADTWRSDDATIATTAALDQRFQDEVNETFTKAELAAASDVMPDNDVAVPTTGAVKDYVDHVVETDILVDGTGLNKTGSGGQVTLGISADSVDFDRIKDADKVQLADQEADYDLAGGDDKVFTASAAIRRFENYVQNTTPSGTGVGKGAVWVDVDDDLTLSVWNGSSWLGITSGGTFTNQPKVVYVDASSGDDSNDGHRISRPKATIKAAINQINLDSTYGDGSVVIVAAGVYQEAAPIQIQKKNVSIIGQALRSCIVHPTVATQGDQSSGNHALFELNSGSYIANLTLTGMKANNTGTNNVDSTLPSNQGWNFAFYSGATITKSPYIQNCTNFSDSEIDNSDLNANTPAGGLAGDTDSAPTGGGALIDGSVVNSASPLRSIVCDSYTHVGLNGPGILVTNNGYCQATSSYAFFNKYHIKCLNGGQANLAASTTDFGDQALVADGKSTTAIFTSNVDGAASDGDLTFNINEPTAGSGWFGNTERPATNMLVEVNSVIYPILSATANTDSEGGAGWTVTISRPNPNNRSENLGLNGAVSDNAAVSFYLRSMIASSGHTMEYVGSGTDYRALPENGGVPNETKQITESNNGKVWTAITDHNGKFKIGGNQTDDPIFEVDQQLGFVTIPEGSIAFNLLSDLTPQLGGDLDANGNDIILDTGTAADPSLTFDGDTDTGLYSPGANQLALATNGTGRLFVDSSGRVFVDSLTDNIIGTNTSDGADNKSVTYSSSNAGVSGRGAYLSVYGNEHATQPGDVFLIAGNAANAELRLNATSSTGFISNYVNGAERLRIDSSGNLGVGTSSPVALAHLANTSSTTGYNFLQITAGSESQVHTVKSTISTGRDLELNTARTLKITTGSNTGTFASEGHIQFSHGTNGDLVRITSDGKLGVGTTSPLVPFHVLTSATNTPGLLEHSGSVDSYLYIKNSAGGAYIASRTDDLSFHTSAGATERARITSDGKLGLGSSTPSAKLVVQDGANTEGAILVGADYDGTAVTNDFAKLAPIHMPHYTNAEKKIRLIAGYSDASQSLVSIGGGTSSANAATKVQIYTGATTTTTAGTAALTIDSSQRVGIGTTAVDRHFHVEGTDNVQGKFQNDSTLCLIEFEDTNTTAGNRPTLGSTGNNLALWTGGSESARIDSSGNVGIGTTSPTEKLQVTDGTNSNFYIAPGYNSDAGTLLGVGGSEYISFATNGLANERMRIDSSGNVGIGGTPTNDANTTTFEVITDDTTARMILTSNAVGGGKYGWYTNNEGQLAAYDYTAASERMRIDSSGNVGIATSSPLNSSGYKTLTIGDDSSVGGQLALNNGSGNRVFFWHDSSGYLHQYNAGDAQIFYTSATEQMRIDSEGRLLIGTSTDAGVAQVIYSSQAATVYQNSVTGTGSNNGFYIGNATNTLAYVWNYNNDDIVWGTNNSERMRLHETGELRVGETNTPSGYHRFIADSTNDNVGALRVDNVDTTAAACVAAFVTATNSSATSNVLIKFGMAGYANGQGQINANGSGEAAFGSFSDKRLKENIVDLPSQWENIKNLRPREFDFIESAGGEHQIGFVAQEMQAIYPDAVASSPMFTGENELSTEERLTITGWGKTNAYLVKALQEAMERIETLEQRLADAGL